VRADGTTFPTEVSVTSFEEHGDLRIMALIRDLSDRQRAEFALRENEAKSRFMATMSHELRTPLNSILGFAQLLGDTSFGSLNERQGRYVGHIRSSGDHLLALINDILDLSKVEAGQLDLQVETVRLSALLEDCVGDIRPLADAKKLDLRFRASDSLSVRADRRRLAQVLVNLLSNAIKFTPEGGRVSVTASADDDGVVVAVRDSGIGIPASQQQHIFDAFFQVREGRTRQQEGTGLGLALSRRLMELMGGSLSVVSREGRGSTFSVRVPRAATLRAGAELTASGA
jgi:signal transduction histidine kinase